MDEKQFEQLTIMRGVEKSLIGGKFRSIASIDPSKLDITGFYCIRLREKSELPPRYQQHLALNRLIYIGKTSRQSLRERFYEQELNAIGHGTFFKSIGAVLKYSPLFGSLVNKKNQNNYIFSEQNTRKIIRWMKENLEVNWLAFNGDSSIEKQLIRTHNPLLNNHHNPRRLVELKEDKKMCREIARSKFPK